MFGASALKFMHRSEVKELLHAAKKIAACISLFFLVLIVVIRTITWKERRDINQGSCEKTKCKSVC
jgi:hypothetical protein